MWRCFRWFNREKHKAVLSSYVFSHLKSPLLEQVSCFSKVLTVLTRPAPLLTSSCVKLWTGPLTETFSMAPFLLSWISPEGRSLVRIYLSLRLSESMSVPFRFCSVIFEEVPGMIQNLRETFIFLPYIFSTPPPSSPAGSCSPLLTVILGPSLLVTSMVNSRRPV